MQTLLEIPGYDLYEPPHIETQETILENDSGKLELVSLDLETGELWLLSENRLKEETPQQQIYPIINGIQFDHEYTNMALGAACPYSLWRVELKDDMKQFGIEEILSLSALARTTTSEEPVNVILYEGTAPDYSTYPVVYEDDRIRMRYAGLFGEENHALLHVENLTKETVLRVGAASEQDVAVTVDGKEFNSSNWRNSTRELAPGNAMLVSVNGRQSDDNYMTIDQSDLTAAKTMSFFFMLEQASYTTYVDKVFYKAKEVTVNLAD